VTCTDCGAHTTDARCDVCLAKRLAAFNKPANGHSKIINWLKVLWHRW
jgi:hypothetical protein